MRFNRYHRHETITVTARMAAAFARKQQRERERYPLFTEHVAEQQISLGTEGERRNAASALSTQHMRNFYARVWREARRDFFAAPVEQRQAIRGYWNAWRGPETALNFRYVVDLCTGVIARRRAAMKAEERDTWARIQEAAGQQRTFPVDFD